jgi:Family of unknown function (DUF5313)
VRSRSETAIPEAPASPPLAGRIHYLIGGMLAPTELEWVRQDLTGPRWRHRQAGRQVLLMLPVAIAFAFLPGQASVRASIPLGLLLIAVVMGYTTGEYFSNRRLDQYGIERPKPIEEDEYLDSLGIEHPGLTASEAQSGVSPRKPRAGEAEQSEPPQEPEYDPEDE